MHFIEISYPTSCNNGEVAYIALICIAELSTFGKLSLENTETYLV